MFPLSEKHAHPADVDFFGCDGCFGVDDSDKDFHRWKCLGLQENRAKASSSTAKLRFDERGSWINSPSDVRGNSYLRVYLLQRLRKCFSEPIPEKIWKADPHPLSIDAHFIFDIVAPETVIGAQVGPQYAPSADPSKFNTTDMDGGQSIERQVVASKQGMYGRKFQFYRVFLSSPLNWKFGPFAGYGIAPTVGIDPSWFVDAIGNLIHPKVKIDPLDHYRDDPDG